MSRITVGLALVALAAGCTWHGTPVPVVGNVGLLEGEWEGTYDSEQTGRTGSILFTLKAGTDSAYGDVLMIPAHAEEMTPPTGAQMSQSIRKMPHVLRISFVRCEEGAVSGRLDPYEDPDTHERISTTFEGRITGNQFQGTFWEYRLPAAGISSPASGP